MLLKIDFYSYEQGQVAGKPSVHGLLHVGNSFAQVMKKPPLFVNLIWFNFSHICLPH